MKLSKVLAALTCALLVFGLLGCGATNKLQSLTLNVTQINGAPITTGQSIVLQPGIGSTIQLQATGNYSNGKSVDLTTKVTFNAYVDPDANVDAFGNTLLPPCKTGTCPNPTQPPPYTTGTVEYSPTGLITGVEPADCTFVDTAPLNPTTGQPQTPSWMYVGDYAVTATYLGLTSQPIYIPIATSGGNTSYGGQENNPDGFCDSGTYSGS